MPKEHRQMKDVKKKAQLTPKEKKQNKRLKKQGGDAGPLIVPPRS